MAVFSKDGSTWEKPREKIICLSTLTGLFIEASSRILRKMDLESSIFIMDSSIRALGKMENLMALIVSKSILMEALTSEPLSMELNKEKANIYGLMVKNIQATLKMDTWRGMAY
jgi:hypothetical protein